RFADGLANRRECKEAGAAALAAVEGAQQFPGFEFEEGDDKQWGEFNAAFAAETVVNRGGYDPWDSAVTCGYAIEFLTGTPRDAEHGAQVAFVLDIFGNPFRSVTINPAWQSPTVLALAAAAYESRNLPAGTLEPGRLPILADALEEAGCDNADMLN